MELIKIVRAIGSFILALIITAMPFMCALSFAYNWSVHIKFVLTIMTIGILIVGTLLIYAESEE